jgi:hypothetical protein
MFGCEEKIKREKEVRKSMEREKYMKNKVDLTCCLVQDRKKRNRRERSVIIF